MDNKNSIVFLNKPINSTENDIIDVSTYVEKLNAAINEGAKMIGVISPFGSGKSSIISLLEEKFPNSNNFIKISMWSHVNSEQNSIENTNEFHKSFLYQLTSQINSKIGTYVSRRLSKNYGFLKFSFINKNTVASFLALFIFIVLVVVSKYIEFFCPGAENIYNLLRITFTLGAIISAIFLLAKADIVFSSNKSEGNRIIEADEIMDLYRTIVLNPEKHIIDRLPIFKCKEKSKKKYIVVIEDLDRSNEPDTVINFLKEIRKYYIPDNSYNDFTNDVVFIISVKPESLLQTYKLSDSNSTVSDPDLSDENKESLYAKLFDYTLNLQTINIDNYEAILNGLLEEKRERLIELGIATAKNSLLKIPGMQWIIRERKLGIREIKERLNIALTIYESLIKKSGQNHVIEFEKCAVAAYLTTAFESDFYKTDDRAYERMIDLYIEGCDNESFHNLIPGTSQTYINTVISLIEAKLIDNTYRTYFYNFPKDSHIYTIEETQIINALLYGEPVANIEIIAKSVNQSGSTIIQDSLFKLDDLKLVYPKIIFESETLYVESISAHFEKVIEFLNKMDYSEKATSQTIATIGKILNFDKERKFFNLEKAFEFCECWSIHFNEDAILKLRKMLCEKYGFEISNYFVLFLGNHSMITEEEIKLIRLDDAIRLTNTKHSDFSHKNIDNLMNVFTELSQENKNYFSEQFKMFLDEALDQLGITIVAPYLLQYMLTTNQIIPEFEEKLINVILDEDAEKDESEDE